MKKTLFPITLVTALLAIISCSKSFESSEENTDIQAHVFTATIDNGDSKTMLGGDESNRTVLWTADDPVNINGATYKAKTGGGTTTTFEYVSGTTPISSPYTAYYPATLSNSSLPTSYNFADATSTFSVNPMYATSTSTFLSFKNICSVLKVTVPQTTDLSVSSIVVSSPDKVLNGVFTINDNTATMSKTSGITDDDRKVTLQFSTPVSVSLSSVVFYVVIPAQTYTTLKIVVNGSLTMVKTIDKTLSRSKIYTLSFTPESGWFSIGSNKTVKFSSGNLQANINSDGNPISWRFATNQYDYIGDNTANTTIGSSAGYVDLFGWSTNATKNNYGIHTNNTSDPEFVAGNFNDWGNNTVLVQNLGSNWFTLSMDQWTHLIEARTNAVNLCKFGVNVCDRSCLVIAPDGFSGDIEDSYDNSEWATAESQGLVCLPSAGIRSASDVSDVDDKGYYWSSTLLNESDAYMLDLEYETIDANSRIMGQSVRLVRE